MPKRILVVEDEIRILAVLRRRLESVGYRVYTAVDGPEGLEVARAEKPDLVILDLMLPKLDGYQVCQELKRDPETSRIPILILTARTQDGDISRGMMSGADAYMTKPFNHTELLGRVQTLLDKAEHAALVQKEDQEEKKARPGW